MNIIMLLCKSSHTKRFNFCGLNWGFESEMLMGKLQGVVASGIAFAVQIWCIDRGGPVFVAVYQPVQTLVVAIMASVALGEEFYLGGWVPIIPISFINHFSLSVLPPPLSPYLSMIIFVSFSFQNPFTHAFMEPHMFLPNRKIKFNHNRMWRV